MPDLTDFFRDPVELERAERLFESVPSDSLYPYFHAIPDGIALKAFEKERQELLSQSDRDAYQFGMTNVSRKILGKLQRAGVIGLDGFICNEPLYVRSTD